ncbi:hypothetical protein [Actinophytocola oryzae]|uniref:Uncharacterized protein n=1 Tax=Actinophytocola oryzae TaxID=502181 RepID=A0A4V3FST9_9PSEU|nr:hypothetical protein [Actinophytocola oryzae]TDV48691.1 hypothetical protein CLV71_10851 [Actinophytocola oryzae]
MNVIECADQDDVERRSRSWSAGEEFPLLAGVAVNRYRDVLAAHGVREWPRAREWSAEGVVVSVGGGAARAAGRLLGSATHRPHEHVAAGALAEHVRRHAAVPVAVVGLVDDLAEARDWPGAWAGRVGVVTARDTGSLLCLVYRTLTVDAFEPGRDLLVTHHSMADAGQADATALDELDELRHGSIRTLVLRTHGRECAASLPDGVLCGRSDHLGAPLPVLADGRRGPSCLRGGGCFRPDLEPHQRLPVADLDARLVFAQSCSAVAVGNAVFPGAVGLGLGFLSGSGVAVLGALGRHTAHVSLRHEFEAAMSEGIPLGDVLHRLNVRGHRLWGELAAFGLLGDPALVLAGPAPPRAPSAAPVADSPVLRALRHWNSTVLPRLERLRWFDLDTTAVAALRDRVRNLTGQHDTVSETVLEETAVAFAQAQEELLGELTRKVHDSWWQFQGGLMSALRLTSSEPCACPHCGPGRATEVRLTHLVDPDLVVRVVQCRRCGPVFQSTGDGPHLRPVEEAVWTGRAVPVDVSAVVANHGTEPVDCAVGFAFVAGDYHELPGPSRQRVWLAGGEARPIRWPVLVTSANVRPDEHEMAFLSLSDGVLTAMSGHLCLTEDSTTDARSDR